MNLPDLKKELENTYCDISFSYADILRLHAAGVLMDGRHSTARLYRKYFTPAALKLLKEHPEYK